MTPEQKVWFAADMEFGSRHTTEAVSEYFIKAWKDVVRAKDIIVLLGDIAWKKQAYWMERINALPGRKLLVKGNHDSHSDEWYLKKGFADVTSFERSLLFRHWMGNILLTHVPASVSVLASYDSSRFMGVAKRHAQEMDHKSCILNIHGHTHGRGVEAHNTFDVSLEAIDYAPISLDMILERRKVNESS